MPAPIWQLKKTGTGTQRAELVSSSRCRIGTSKTGYAELVSQNPAPAPAAGAETVQASGSELVPAHQKPAPALTP